MLVHLGYLALMVCLVMMAHRYLRSRLGLHWVRRTAHHLYRRMLEWVHLVYSALRGRLVLKVRLYLHQVRLAIHLAHHLVNRFYRPMACDRMGLMVHHQYLRNHSELR